LNKFSTLSEGGLKTLFEFQSRSKRETGEKALLALSIISVNELAFPLEIETEKRSNLPACLKGRRVGRTSMTSHLLRKSLHGGYIYRLIEVRIRNGFTCRRRGGDIFWSIIDTA